jgi:6-phosphogluconate dehydrogenase (decarboxylating)
MGDYMKRIGFIGLGAMGKHMAAQLAAKLPPNSKLFVYDIVKGPIDELITKFPGKVIASASPRDVAKNTVWGSVPFFSPMDGQRSSLFVLPSLVLSFLRWE